MSIVKVTHSPLTDMTFKAWLLVLMPLVKLKSDQLTDVTLAVSVSVNCHSMESSPFWYPSHSVLPCLQNCVKDTSRNDTTTDFEFCLHSSTPPPVSLIPVHACVHMFVCMSVCVGVLCARNILCLYICFDFFVFCMFARSCKTRFAHTCRLDALQYKLPLLLILLLYCPWCYVHSKSDSLTDVSSRSSLGLIPTDMLDGKHPHTHLTAITASASLSTLTTLLFLMS